MDIPPDAGGSQAFRGIFTSCKKNLLLDTLSHKTTEIAFYGKPTLHPLFKSCSLFSPLLECSSVFVLDSNKRLQSKGCSRHGEAASCDCWGVQRHEMKRGGVELRKRKSLFNGKAHPAPQKKSLKPSYWKDPIFHKSQRWQKGQRSWWIIFVVRDRPRDTQPKHRGDFQRVKNRPPAHLVHSLPFHTAIIKTISRLHHHLFFPYSKCKFSFNTRLWLRAWELPWKSPGLSRYSLSVYEI